MPSVRSRLGNEGERVARRFLESQGYRIWECNYRCSRGEVDIVAEDDGCLVFVEVRSRRSVQFGTPEESVSRSKQRKLIATSLTYLQSCEAPTEHWRIDLVSVRFFQGYATPKIDHMKYAVQAGDDLPA